jgi:hypothetical protein
MAKHSQGTTANYTGSSLEQFIEARLVTLGYKQVDKKRFMPTTYLEQPIYARQFYLGRSIYETNFFCDFIIYHPEKWPNNLVIESKWQQSGGSVDEKFPYLVLNHKLRSKYPCIILLDGSGYKQGAENWLKNETDDKLLHVFNMSQFQTWTNKGNL